MQASGALLARIKQISRAMRHGGARNETDQAGGWIASA
jgi:hypothetical protein